MIFFEKNLVLVWLQTHGFLKNFIKLIKKYVHFEILQLIEFKCYLDESEYHVYLECPYKPKLLKNL